MNFEGIIIGLASFLIIGIFHPIVIKSEYYIGKKVWPVFLILGIITLVISLFLNNTILSIIVGIVGFTLLWSIHEVIEQEKRVQKGWFQFNPKRKK
ncbi:MAG: DUF4491 family protein [Methanobrevibacter sp.]|jgi:uncharacterized membrane protein|nr:DUF4491 family protein [Candidatus Methanoflexus mossambicus]